MRGSDFHLAEMATDLVPGPVEYAVLTPHPLPTAADPVPLLLFLHGGNGDRRFLRTMQRVFESVWAAGTLPPAVVVTPSAGRSLYLDFQDGSQRWETFLRTQLIPHLRRTYPVIPDRSGTALCGISMGGFGSLLLGFKHPEEFLAVAAIEPAVMPALEFDAVPAINQAFRDHELLEQLHGQPFDPAHWRANNPAAIAIENADRIRQSRLALFFECGDRDRLRLYDGANFLHHTLTDAGIPHEYQLVPGADHIGPTVAPRLQTGLEFLGRVLLADAAVVAP
jgi:S-formylglutathione hydrolase